MDDFLQAVLSEDLEQLRQILTTEEIDENVVTASLINATRQRKAHVVEVLIPYANTHASNSLCLQSAVYSKDQRLIDLLWWVSDHTHLLALMLERDPDSALTQSMR